MKGQLPGPNRGFEGGPSKPSRKASANTRAAASSDPLSGVAGRLSTGYPVAPDLPVERRSPSARLIEGQNLRGYVNASTANLPEPKDVTVSPTGPKLIRRKGN